MLESFASSLSVLATVIGTMMSLGYFPQVIKIYSRKSVADISLPMFGIFFPGTLVWLLYGLSIDNTALIVANIVGLLGVGFIILEYLYYRK